MSRTKQQVSSLGRSLSGAQCQEIYYLPTARNSPSVIIIVTLLEDNFSASNNNKSLDGVGWNSQLASLRRPVVR